MYFVQFDELIYVAIQLLIYWISLFSYFLLKPYCGYSIYPIYCLVHFLNIFLFE